MRLIDPTVEFLDGDNGNPFVIKKTQEITPDHLRSLSDARLQSSHKPCGDWHRVASIPTGVVEKWAREGFDILKGQHSPKEILRKLQSEDLGAFITTNKRI